MTKRSTYLQVTEIDISRALTHMHRIQRPEFVGVLASAINHSIEHGEKVVMEMMNRSLLREATQIEKKQIDASENARVVALVGSYSEVLAHQV